MAQANPRAGDATPPASVRRKLLARVHCLKRDHGLDDDTWRDMLRAGWGVDSSALLSPDQLGELARRLETQGGGRPEYPGRPRNMGPMGPAKARRQAAARDTRAAQLQKIEALLTEAGRPWSYADALAQRICKTTKLQWVSTDQLYKIITALVKDAERHGRPAK